MVLGATTCPTFLRAPWIRSRPVVDLRLLPRRCLDAGVGDGVLRVQLPHEALDRLVVPVEAVSVHQLLPDRLGVATPRDGLVDERPVGLALARNTRLRLLRVGERFTGRFCRPLFAAATSCSSLRSHAAYATSLVMIDMVTIDMTTIGMAICPISWADLVSSCLKMMALSHVEARVRPIALASMTEISATAFHMHAVQPARLAKVLRP